MRESAFKVIFILYEILFSGYVPLCYYHMYRTFADPKLLCRLPYSGVAFYDIIGDFHGSFFNIIFQENPPANLVFTMYEKRGRFITLFFLS